MTNKSPPTHTLPFGRHGGLTLDEVPTDCLIWFLGNVEKISSGLRAAITAELKLRGVVPPFSTMADEEAQP
jgi:hypothetical protein